MNMILYVVKCKMLMKEIKIYINGEIYPIHGLEDSELVQ